MIKALYTEHSRLTNLYNLYLDKTLQALYANNEVEYQKWLFSTRIVRKNLHKIEEHIKEIEGITC